jgi:VIT1/CCC1 family predicted Fe2+/Mn2+ transporter
MSQSSGEQELINNQFGVISDQRVIFPSNKSLFSSGSQEEFPIRQIVSARFYKQKSIPIAAIGAFLGTLLPILIIAFLPGNIVAIIMGLLVLAMGLWVAYVGISGVPKVIIKTTEGKTSQATGWPNHKDEAKAFALVLREKINT